MDDIHKNIEECNSCKKRKILIVFDDMIADMLSNKKLNPLVTEYLSEAENQTFLLFLLHNLILLCQELNKLHLIIHQILNLKNINLYKKSAAKRYSFSVINATLASDNHLRFRKN